jgi:Tol biopolymer transport system component
MRRAIAVLVCAALIVLGVIGAPKSVSAAGPSLGVGDVVVQEGDAGKVTVVVPLTLETPSAVSVVVSYSIASTDATAGSEYVRRNGKVTFKPGVTTRPVNVVVYGDTALESAESVVVQITNASNASVIDGTGVVTIRDDDVSVPVAGSAPEVAVGDGSVWEGDTGSYRQLSIPVTLSKPAPSDVVVRFATSCSGADLSDFKSASVSLKFRAGQRSKSVKVKTVPDLYVEDNEAFTTSVSVTSGSATVADGAGEAVVSSDDNSGGLARVSDRSVAVGCAADGGNGNSASVAVSGNGRFVAFDSEASNLVPGDTNGVSDVFVRDLLTGAMERISVSSTGSQSDGRSSEPAMSADGRYVVFQSDASNLTAADTNAWSDAFVRDRVAQTTQRIGNVTGFHKGSGSPSISADGRYIAFTTSASLAGDTDPCITVVGDLVCEQFDVYVLDQATAAITLVTVGQGGPGAGYLPQISGDGNVVAFLAADWANAVVGDNNNLPDVFTIDRATGITDQVSVNDAGNPATGTYGIYPERPSLSDDGRYVTFVAHADNLGATQSSHQVYVRDRTDDTTTVVSQLPDGSSVGMRGAWRPSISGNGRYVVFETADDGLSIDWTPPTQDQQGGKHAFLRDLVTDETSHVDITPSGDRPLYEAGFLRSTGHAISEDGGVIAFSSSSNDLVAGDIEGYEDVFVLVR